jgi:NAD(P)-dependent dehydrogenase (short-subunit alcohol dehydrogenase family)
MPMMRIEGATALVTGANRGLGKALVGAFLEAGAGRVYATLRDPSLAPFTDPRVEWVRLDLTAPSSVEEVARRCGDTDILVNNAASLANTPCLAVADLAGARLEMETNYWGVLALCRAFAPQLAERDGRAIVNILSIGALACVPFAGTYCASKAAQWSLTQCLRAELGKTGVSVAAVFPGPIATDMARPGDAGGRCPPEIMAATIVAELGRNNLMIFPDPVSAAIREGYSADPWALERQFAGSVD